jgi:hypothetical protein
MTAGRHGQLLRHPFGELVEGVGWFVYTKRGKALELKAGSHLTRWRLILIFGYDKCGRR